MRSLHDEERMKTLEAEITSLNTAIKLQAAALMSIEKALGNTHHIATCHDDAIKELHKIIINIIGQLALDGVLNGKKEEGEL